MELYQLRTFLAVADEGNLTRASERLFTSQPAISAHIKALEEELSVKLFERTSKGMMLTPEGVVLKEKAQGVMSAAQAFTSTADALQGQLIGDIRMGVNTDGEFLRLSKMLSGVRTEHPKLKMRFIQEVSGNITHNILHETLDCGFFFGENPHPEIETVILSQVNFMLCASIAWKDQVVGASWDELTNLPWVFPIPQCPYMQIFEQAFAKYQKQPEDVAHASSEAAVNALIKEGVGVSLIREDEALAMKQRKALVIWEQETYSMPLHFGFLKARRDDPAICALKKVATEIWQHPVKQPTLKAIS
ncbi:MAG: LysR family transcriptional regulator [Chromatiales bacterium]|nr:LysR family transcriptional regulator [Chromatiales bacterium]